MIAKLPLYQDLAPYAGAIRCAAGEDGSVSFQVLDADRATRRNLTACQLLLTITLVPDVGLPSVVVSRQATITDAANGLGFFPIISGDTLTLAPSAPAPGVDTPGSYVYDVWLTDAGVTPNLRYQLAFGTWVVGVAEGQPGQPVTVPPSQVPLALGPVGVSIFDPTVNYAVNQLVTYFNSPSWNLYQCYVATTAGDLPTDTTHWHLVGAGGVGVGTNRQAYMTRLIGSTLTPGWYSIGAADVVPAFAITSFTVPASIEYGATLVNPSGTVGYNRTPVSAQVTDGSLTDVLSTPFTAWSLTHTYGPASAINQFVTFTASAVGDDGGTPSTSAFTYIGLGRAYWGMVNDPGSGGYTSAFANALASNRLQLGRSGSYAFGTGDGVKFPFLVIPVAWGDFAALIDQNQDSLSFTKVASSVNVVNGQSVNVPCDFFRIDAQPVSAITVAGS